VNVTAAPRELRPYQVEAVDAVMADWGNEIRRVGVVLPTGAGKSTVIAKIADRAADMGLRVVMLAHRGELLNQMAEAVAAVNPLREPVGIVRAEQDDHHAQIVAATLQTLTHARRREALGRRDVVLWDEVHHVGAEGWHNVGVELGMYSGAFFCGFTATMRRDDAVALGESIEKVSYEKDLRWAIDSGYLTQPHGLTVQVDDLDLSTVKTTAGDFNQGELAEVMEAAQDSVVHAIRTHAADRRAIIFASSVLAAQSLAEALYTSGIPTGCVTGEMGMDHREEVYVAFRTGAVQMLVTVMVLTEGADFPMCDAVVIARPTRSQNLYSQMVGRALRLHPGKDDALVLDLVGSSRILSLATLTDLDAKAPIRKVDEAGNEMELVDPLDAEEPAPRERQIRMGPLDVVTIDLLANDTLHKNVLWLQTKGGVPFLDVQEGYLAFLWPGAEDTWRAGWITSRGDREGGWIQDGFTDTDTAACAAEDWTSDRFTLPLRTRSWRSSQPPSEKQINFARMLGIGSADQMTKARLSDEISTHLATRRLDVNL
jgi:superfamily II DNA or RNA helicase